MAKRLTRIYTRSGDDGTTGLAGGERLPKDHLRIEAIGAVDELNSVIGLLRAQPLEADIDKLLQASMSNEAIIEEAYLTCLARRPTAEENAGLLAQMSAIAEGEKRLVVEDLFWALMSSREFLFNH